MKLNLKTQLSRLGGLIALVATLGLSACGGSGPGVSANPVPSGSGAQTYAGPAPSSADVQAFKINFWENVRSANRCGGCHNETKGQMPNFARSDDVNLAYMQANTVLNLTDPSQSHIVAKVGGGHNCWLSDPSACASIMTTWIANWAGASAGGGTQIQLTAPVIKGVGTSRNFPADSTSFAAKVYPLLTTYCSKCHAPTAAVPQQPFFASANVDEAYAAARPKMNLDTPADSRFVIRLGQEFHNCWTTNGGTCASDAIAMQNAIAEFAGDIQPTTVDASLVISKALTMYDGTVASGGSRFDSNAIAKYEFKTGKGVTAFDTSGVDPAADMTLSGNVTWVGGWGLKFGAGGKAQASTAASKKIHDMILGTGEFSLEAWVAPANVTQEMAYMLSYSGGTMQRNFTLGQSQYNYDAFLRSSATDANGMPALSTADAAKRLQASLQHVVVTYDPVGGRKIYVNGVYTGDMDKQTGGTISNWDNTFALVLGNEVSSNRSWTGVIKFVAIHNRALTPAQITQNFAAGVGERYFLLFNVEQPTGVSQGYVMFEVSIYDTYSYLFNKPVFISLDPNAKPDNIVVKGIRIGVNGVIPNVGQAYIPLDTVISASNYFAGQGQALSSIGTVIGLDKGAELDTFFLSFDQLGSNMHVVTEPQPIQPAPVFGPVSSKIGVRTFDRINASMSAITNVPKTNAKVSATFQTVKQQLPTSPTLEGFLSSHQVGIAQLAIQYCSEMLNDTTKRSAMFPGVDFSAPGKLGTQTGRNAIINPLVTAALGSNLSSQDALQTASELDNLITNLKCNNGSCSAQREIDVTKAVCAAAIGGAGVVAN